ncbi:MAG: hypothetical protein ACKO2L_06330 [Planctomycetaceae bacterium]
MFPLPVPAAPNRLTTRSVVWMLIALACFGSSRLLAESPVAWNRPATAQLQVEIPAPQRAVESEATDASRPPDDARPVPDLQAAPADCGYWIVSTENSPQSFDDSLPRFCATVRRYDHCHGVRATSLAELLGSLTPGIPVCIMVHGSFMDSGSVVSESLRTWQWLRHGAHGRPFHLIYFRWPSWRLPSALINIDIVILGRRASRNGFYLAELLRLLPSESPVSLLGHSHGTRVISSAAHLLAGGSVEGFGLSSRELGGQRLRAIFAASAIDHDWLNPGERFDRALCSLQGLLNLQNRHDPALLLYPAHRVGARRALGHIGLTEKDRRALGTRSRQVRDLDVTKVIGCRHLWPVWTAEPSLACRASADLFWPE